MNKIFILLNTLMLFLTLPTLFASEKKEKPKKVIANAEQNAIQETNNQFDSFQQSGTPEGEVGPIASNTKSSADDEIANAEQNAFHEVDDQFWRLQEYGTPIEESGPIPVEYDNDIYYDADVENDLDEGE